MTVKINGEILPETAIAFELGRLIRFYSEHLSQEQIKQQMPILQKKAKEQAIGAKLLLEQAKKLDIIPPTEMINKKMQEMIRSVGGEAAFRKILESQKLSEAQIKESIEQGCKVDILLERVTKGVPEPTDEEIERHFKEHAGEYKKPEKVSAQHILIKVDKNAAHADRELAKSRLTEIRAKIMEGADFSDMAAAYSDCPSGRKTGGSLGWVSKGMLLPEFERALFALEIGEISEIVETTLGFHIIKKNDYEGEQDGDLDESRDRIRYFLRHVRRGEVIKEYVAELRSKAVIEDNEN